MGQLRKFVFVQLDVFTTTPLEGNMLAVFTDARGLNDSEMQRIAKEMNLSETTFILPRDPQAEREQGVKVRIFAVTEELPFAGHPTLGTAAALHKASGAEDVTLDLKVGKVPVTFLRTEEGAFGEMRQPDPEFGAMHDREAVARATGLSTKDFDENLPIQTVSTGLPFTIAPLRSLEVIQKLHIDHNRATEYLQRSGGQFFYWVAQETVDPKARVHARMLFYNGEDPATGSAAGCAAAWMVAHGVIKPGESALIEQGAEMKRPSKIFVRADKAGDRVINVRVGGYTVEVLRGELFF